MYIGKRLTAGGLEVLFFFFAMFELAVCFRCPLEGGVFGCFISGTLEGIRVIPRPLEGHFLACFRRLTALFLMLFCLFFSQPPLLF